MKTFQYPVTRWPHSRALPVAFGFAVTGSHRRVGVTFATRRRGYGIWFPTLVQR